jgi:hypothetical protein
VGSFYSAHHVGVICLTQTTRERTGLFFFLASCFCPPLESSSELWPAWGKGKGTAREQGKSILGSQLAHLRRQLGKWPWGCCCIGVLRPWRQKLDGSSGRPWNQRFSRWGRQRGHWWCSPCLWSVRGRLTGADQRGQRFQFGEKLELSS